MFARHNSITLGFEDQALENRVLKQEKIVRFKERGKDNDIHLDAFLNVGNDKKRARPLDIRDILNDDVQDTKVRKTGKRHKRVMRQLREIVGRQGKGPVDYEKLAEDIQVHINLMELFQISPDLSKAFRALSTRVNEKAMKTRMKNELPRPPQLSENTISSEALLSKAAGPHFGEMTRKFAEENGIIWCHSAVAAKKAVGMAEKAVDLVQRVLKKKSDRTRDWAASVPTAVLKVNKREIPHLLYSPAQILFGFDPIGTLGVKFPNESRSVLAAGLSSGNPDVYPDKEEHSDKVIDYVVNRAKRKSVALERSNQVKDRSAKRHDLGIRREIRYSPGDLVMLFDHRQAGKKLRPSRRGPFAVTGFEGDMGKSYTIHQLNGKPIPRHYHGDSLKKFRLREGYLVTGDEEALPSYQNIRLGNTEFRLPKFARPEVDSPT
ncbi:hypothetical protein K3495_g13383 [Podosphaera aphanis]|nr:hypothetical protein K3495_g13383 [Podosphaera aphanis]